MITESQPLGGFEERLLAELKDVVRAGAAPQAVTATRGRGRRRALVAVAAAVATFAGFGAFSGFTDTPAFAVSRNPDGSVHLHIKEFRDAAGLQRVLRANGVAVVVDFLPNGKDCAEPRATYIDDREVSALIEPVPRTGAGFAWTLHAERLKPGQTVVLTTKVVYDRPGHVSASEIGMHVATGPVAPCRLVPGRTIPDVWGPLPGS
jgi:hypothetical protein